MQVCSAPVGSAGRVHMVPVSYDHVMSYIMQTICCSDTSVFMPPQEKPVSNER